MSHEEAAKTVTTDSNDVTSRVVDGNGWFEVKGNPLSKVGIFQYSGAQVGGDPSKVYNVYRPEEELSNPETLDSFRLLPWIDDHVMLGNPDTDQNLTPAEKKGIEGVIGEEVFFKDGILYGNIKVFSENLAALIESGKKQLSAGYRCVYELVSGTWNGQPFDAIQRNIRGNHLALVDEGRMGKEVAVLDHLTFTFDTKELKMTNTTLDERMQKICDWAEGKMAKDEAEEKEAKEKEAEDAVKGLAADAEEEEKEKEKKDGMDAAAMDAKLESFKKNFLKESFLKDALAQKLSAHVGTFDSADKTLQEVAEYGVEKLGLACPKGSEKVALDGFLHNRETTTSKFVLDSNSGGKKSGKLAAFINSNK